MNQPVDAVEAANDLRTRVLEAEHIKQELGEADLDPERRLSLEADLKAVEPTDEEIKQGLIFLRTQRSASGASTSRKTPKPKVLPSDLSKLFDPKPADANTAPA